MRCHLPIMHRIGFIPLAVLAATLLPISVAAQPPTANSGSPDDTSAITPTTALFDQPRSLAHPARLSNLSVRAPTGTGDAGLIAGAVVRGAGTLPILVRAVGPGLAQFGVADHIRAPELEVYRGAALNARTTTASAAAIGASAYVGAFPLRDGLGGLPGNDAAMTGDAEAGNLTALCASSNSTPGIALLEFYDTTAAPSAASPRFVNFSARARAGLGEGLIIVGFSIAGQGEMNLMLRGVGQTLQGFNLGGLLNDPAIELYAGNTLIASNDNWGPDQQSRLAVQAAESALGTFALTSANDAALIVTLPAGSYTLQVRDSGGGSGVAAAEIYELAPTPSQFDAAQATNAVGLELYRKLAPANPGKNLVLSPYSIESALALAYAGAEGDTRREMAGVLRLPDDTAALQAGFAALRLALENVAEQSKQLAATRTAAGRPTDPIQWQAANRLFGQLDYAFRESFLTLMRDGFAAPFQVLDFRRNTEGARLTINEWVEDQTRDKIRDLIPFGALSEFTRLVLVNALYLNAPWHEPFATHATAARSFRLADGTSVNVPTMQQTAPMGHAVENGTTIVTLDYLGGALQFLIILPAEGTSADSVAARLTSADFARWAKLGNAPRNRIALYLPKFRVEGTTVPLGTVLKAMGMNSAFDVPRGSANFDRIAQRRPDEYLFISDVYHQTFIALDEQGTEAAAATAVVIDVTTAVPPPPVEVRVDRPFLFAIQHRASGACLFLGRIADPR